MSENIITITESDLSALLAQAAALGAQSALNQPANVVTAPVTEAPAAPVRSGKPVTRTNRERVIKAMTREGWTGHEHYSTRELVELLGAEGCPKGFYLPTGTVKARIAAAKAV